MNEQAKPYRDPAFGDPPRRRAPGDPPLLRKPRLNRTPKPTEQPPPPPVQRAPRRDIDDELVALLQALSEAPRLSKDLPGLGRALFEAGERGFAVSRCLEIRPAPEKSLWRWQITGRGREWLKARECANADCP